MAPIANRWSRYSPNEVNLPLPDVEDLSDCESSDSESIINGASVTQPVKAFFLGCRKSQLYTPRDLESGLAFSNNSSIVDLPKNEGNYEKTERRPRSSLPARQKRYSRYSVALTPLPPKRGSKLYRYIRWNLGSVYRRVFCLAFLGNLIAIAVVVARSLLSGSHLTYDMAATAVSANILAAMLVRNEHLVNAMFVVFASWPKHLPLSCRRLLAKVYTYGGLHSGCSVAATFWYIAFLVLLTQGFTGGDLSTVRSYGILVSYSILFLLILILVFAHPRLRAVMHNWFEGIHRYLGWSVILLFWAQTLLLTADGSRQMPFAMALVMSPTFWMLIAITLLVIYPWTRLRLRDVEAEVLSEHCVKLNFKYANVHYGQAVRLSDAPLKETHAFAVIPNSTTAQDAHQSKEAPFNEHRGVESLEEAMPSPATVMSEKFDALSYTTSPPPSPALSSSSLIPGRTQANMSSTTSPVLNTKGFSVIVSNAGDWTSKIIRSPPRRIYTRGAPQFGVLRVAGLFRPCVVVATGSGIGPCLSLFVQRPDHPVRIVWSAPSPLQTYGREVVDAVYRADPDAVVIDSRTEGRPDLVGIAYRIWEGSRSGGWRGGLGQLAALNGGIRETSNGAGGNFNDTRAKTTIDVARREALGPCEAVVIISNQRVTRKVVYGLESRGVAAYGAIFDS